MTLTHRMRLVARAALAVQFASLAATCSAREAAFDASGWKARGAASFSVGGRFDSDAWLERRASCMADAMRLREIYGKCVKALRSPAENVTVPVENYDDGSVKTSVHAEKAQFFVDDGLVWGEGVVVSHFSEVGAEVARLTAQNCVVDRRAKCGWAEGRARVTYGGTSVEGEGVYFSVNEEYVIIADNTRIETVDLKIGGLKL